MKHDLTALREAVATMKLDYPVVYDAAEMRDGLGFVIVDPDDGVTNEAYGEGIACLLNAAPSLLDEVERVRAEHEYQLCEAQRWAGRAEQAEAEVAALKAAPCPCCGAMAEDYVEGRCLDVDNDPGVFTSGEPHD